MSHPDPCYDPDNSYEDDMNYDDYNDFYDGVDADDRTNEYWPNLTTGGDDIDAEDLENGWNDNVDDSMDGDHDSAMESAGWGTDEDYGHYGDDIDAFHDYYGGE